MSTRRIIGVAVATLGLTTMAGLAMGSPTSASEHGVFMEGNPSCADLNLGIDGLQEYKNDSGDDATAGGFVFTHSDGGTTVTVSIADPDATPNIVIEAVIIKGGDNATVLYSAPWTGSPPANQGENVPTVSHTSVCYTDVPPPTTSSTTTTTTTTQPPTTTTTTTQPPATTTTTTEVESQPPATTTTLAPATTTSEVASQPPAPQAPPAAPAAPAPEVQTLPATGLDGTTGPLVLGTLASLLGAALILTARRRGTIG